MNLDEAVKEACEQPTLLDALAWICVWESERVVKQAHEFLSGRASADPEGRGWDTAFRYCLQRVFLAYSAASHAPDSNLPFSSLVKVEDDLNIITVCGMRYARSLFENFGGMLPIGSIFKLIGREDGTIQVGLMERYHPAFDKQGGSIQ